MDADRQQYTRQRGGTSQQCLERFAKRREKADSRREIQPRIETGLLWKLLSILFVQRRYSANGCCRGRFRHALGFGTKSCTASSRVERPGLSQNSSLQEERTRPQLGSGIRAENSTPQWKILQCRSAQPASKCCFVNTRLPQLALAITLLSPNRGDNLRLEK